MKKLGLQNQKSSSLVKRHSTDSRRVRKSGPGGSLRRRRTNPFPGEVHRMAEEKHLGKKYDEDDSQRKKKHGKSSRRLSPAVREPKPAHTASLQPESRPEHSPVRKSKAKDLHKE